MALWKRLWLLFSVIWIVVAALQVITIVAFADEVERGKAVLPLVFGIAVPAVLYGVGSLWARLRRK